MFVLDTNVVSELRKAKSGRANAQVVAWAESVQASHLFLSSITILELEQGVLRVERKDAAQGSIIRAWLDRQVLPAFKDRILSIDSAVALRCARLHVPDPQAERDSLIAATALVHGFAVVTRNVEDFAATGVSILNPWEVER
jgi:predicted nucleic acid-binding protein